MRIDINYCGTNSIAGAIADKVILEGLAPEHILVNINLVMQGTDVDRELAKAKDIFKARGFRIELGTVTEDLYKEQLERDPNAICFS